MKKIEAQDIRPVVTAKDRLGEVPLWCTRTQRLWWVDGRKPSLQSYDPETREHKVYPLEGKTAGGYALRERGGFILAMEDGVYGYDTASGKREMLVHPEPGMAQNRLNDGKCDRRGRFWVGSMNDVVREPHGSLYRIDSNHTFKRFFGEIIIPNAIAFSPEDRTMYFADTRKFTIWAFDFDLASGEISNRRVFVDTTSHPGRPDGAAVDAEGYLWNAEFAGSRVVRYAPDGRIDGVIAMPVSQPTSCAFGGRNLDTLYVTSCSGGLTPEQLAAEPLAGSLFAIDVGVRGVAEPRFAG